MNEVKHTPGPWKANKWDSGFVWTAENELVAIAKVPKKNRDEVADAEKMCMERDANAKLMASAPEMLEALKRIYIEAKDIYACAIEEIASKAIDKAEGKRQ